MSKIANIGLSLTIIGKFVENIFAKPGDSSNISTLIFTVLKLERLSCRRNVRMAASKCVGQRLLELVFRIYLGLKMIQLQK